jgi:hypothetical protein
MGGGTLDGKWWNPIWRMSKGWLTSRQVVMASKSGTYDLYADNDTFTSDPRLPLILEVPVTVAHEGVMRQHYIYIILVNQKNIEDIKSTWSEDSISHQFNGIQIVAPALSTYLSPLSQHKSLSVYSYSIASTVSTDRLYKTAIPPTKSVRLKWPGTDIKITHLERRARQHSRVQVQFCSVSTPCD